MMIMKLEDCSYMTFKDSNNKNNVETRIGEDYYKTGKAFYDILKAALLTETIKRFLFFL